MDSNVIKLKPKNNKIGTMDFKLVDTISHYHESILDILQSMGISIHNMSREAYNTKAALAHDSIIGELSNETKAHILQFLQELSGLNENIDLVYDALNMIDGNIYSHENK